VTRVDDPGGRVPVGREPFAAHVADCEVCRADPPPVERFIELLSGAAGEIDAAALSRATLVRLRTELERRTRTLLRRRVTAGVLRALLPLPLVWAYNAYCLRLVYDLVSVRLPAALAAYFVLSYAALLLLLFAATYAVIPIALARGTLTHRPAQG
jgi:sirohydrochlorin ferrochelatase